jgi:hypothetical protein
MVRKCKSSTNGWSNLVANKSYSPLERREFKHAEDLWEMRKGINSDVEEWRVNTVFYPVLDSKPHLACPLIDCAIPDDRIRRAELLSILRLTKSAMRHVSGRKPMVWHMIYPVSLTHRIKNHLLTTNP